MIGIGIDQFFILFNILMMSILAGFWLRQLLRENVYDWNISQELLCWCKNCNLTFVVKRIESVARCPKCDDPD